MTNFLDNGTVLPNGLLANNGKAMMEGFNKSYKNTSLRVGVIVNIYPKGDPKNRTGLTTEYDVVSVEQNEDRGATTILYRNCLSSDGIGSIADFFEKNLRSKQAQTYKGNAIRLNGQNGATVLLLCLDSTSDKAMIIGGFPHPDHVTTLTDSSPHLEGEYNGVNIKVNSDGSTSLTFKGATDNNGSPTSSPGNTEIKIEASGSLQIDHSSATLRLDKGGDITITANSNININANAGCNIKSSGKTVVTASEIDLNGSSGKVLTDATQPIVDSIFGEPAMGVSTVKAG